MNGAKTLGELEKVFHINDTPENRMNLHELACAKEGEIARKIVKLLSDEQITIRRAIGLLREAERIIMESEFKA